jgi:ABC-type transporter Mla MlaB component
MYIICYFHTSLIWIFMCCTSNIRRRREDNIKVDLREIGWEGVNWVRLTQVHWRILVKTVMNLWVSWNTENFLTSSATVSFSKSSVSRVVSYEYAAAKLIVQLIKHCKKVVNYFSLYVIFDIIITDPFCLIFIWTVASFIAEWLKFLLRNLEHVDSNFGMAILCSNWSFCSAPLCFQTES